jgi:thymidylate kinase
MNEMSNSGINMIFIKSFGEIPFDSHNYDILLRKEDVEITKKLLEDSGFKESKHLNEPFKWFFRRVDSDLVLSIHLHTRVAWEGVRFVDEADLWLRYRKLDIQNVKLGFPSPEHSILITTAHAFFENRCLKLCDLINVAESLHADDVDWSYLADWTTRDHWFGSLYSFLHMLNCAYESLFEERLIEKEAFDTLLAGHKSIQNLRLDKITKKYRGKMNLPMKISTILVARSYINKVLETTDDPLIKRIEKVASTGWHYFKNRVPPKKQLPLFLIRFSGQDGSGKTVHARHLHTELEEMIHLMNDELVEKDFRVVYVWSRGIGSTIGPLMGAIRKVLLAHKFPEEGEYRFKREKLLVREPIRTLWAYFTLVDELLQLQTKVRVPLLLQRMVISDRYIQDAIIDVECDLNKNVSWVVKKILTDLLPRPKLVFITDADIDEIWKRRKSINPDVAECKRQRYLGYLRGEEYFLVDTTEKFEENSKQIFQRVLETLVLSPSKNSRDQ